MAIGKLTTTAGRCRIVLAAALFAATALTAAPRPAGAIDTGAAVGIGLGSFALGSMLGAHPYPYGYPAYGYGYPAPPAYYYPPAPAYYPPAPAYPQGRSCWDAYYQRYVAC